MASSRFRRSELGVALTVVLLAGCGGRRTSESDEASIKELSFLSAMSDGENDYSAQANLLIEAEVEQYVAECMRDAGFEYVPNPTWAQSLATTDWAGSSRAYAEANGFGVFRRLERQADQPDPNEAYVKSLSAAGAKAYSSALTGDTPEANDDCFSKAYRDVDEANEIEMAVTLGDEIVVGAETSASVAAVEKDWAACMHEQGFEYTTHAHMRATLNEEATTLLGVDENSPEFSAFRQNEIRTAIASFDCGQTYRAARMEAIREALDDVPSEFAGAVRLFAEHAGGADRQP